MLRIPQWLEKAQLFTRCPNHDNAECLLRPVCLAWLGCTGAELLGNIGHFRRGCAIAGVGCWLDICKVAAMLTEPLLVADQQVPTWCHLRFRVCISLHWIQLAYVNKHEVRRGTALLVRSPYPNVFRES